MPSKSKTAKAADESPTEETSAVSEKEEIKEEEAEKTPEVTPVPSWRAEVVEEGTEEEKKETIEKVEEEPLEKKEEIAPPALEVTQEEKLSEPMGEVKLPEDTASVDLTMQPEAEEGKGKKVFIIVFVLVLIAGLVAGGLYYYKTKVSPSSETTQKETETTPAPTLTPTAAPEEEVKLEDFSVQVLNGSGIVGEAGKVEALLTTAGFATIDTGNADSYSYTISEVSLKKDTPEAVYSAIKKALVGYKIVRQETLLDEKGDYDVKIVVGSTKADASPTPSQ